jgi:hypothetical protein
MTPTSAAHPPARHRARAAPDRSQLARDLPLLGGPCGWAELSPCGTYRYLLGRRVGAAQRGLLLVCLNPSTADASLDDPTIRRAVGFTRREGCGVLEVVNLFAFRATDPAALRTARDPVGPANDRLIAAAVGRAAVVVVAWGVVHRQLAWRAGEVAAAIRQQLPVLGHRGPFCLGTTANGSPRHPLYVRSDRPLERWLP